MKQLFKNEKKGVCVRQLLLPLIPIIVFDVIIAKQSSIVCYKLGNYLTIIILFCSLSPGMYEFSSTGQLLPILIGTQMDDPSGQMVLILGAERDPETDSLRPLGGTMEDPDGDGIL